MASKMLARTQEILENTFNTEQVHIFSSTLISYLTVRDLFRNQNDYVILEVHGEVTDTSIIRDGILLESTSFPVGTNHLIRTLAGQMKLRPEDIKSRMKLILEGKTERESKHAETVEATAYESLTSWMDALRKSLEKISGGSPVPNTTFLFVDPVWELYYATALRDHSFELFTFTNRPFNVITLNQKLLCKYCKVQQRGDFLPLTIATALMYDKLPLQEARTSD